jgi:hypothetical protein
VTGCGCLAVVAGVVALLVIFVRGSFDAGEPIDTAVAFLVLSLLTIQWWQRKRPADQLVGARRT